MTDPGNTKGGRYHCTVNLLFDWFGISCMTTDNFCFYFQDRLIQTSQTRAQWYSDTSPFSIPWLNYLFQLADRESRESHERERGGGDHRAGHGRAAWPQKSHQPI
jgi:hypothetical protein